MPVTAKLSRRFYETFGDDIANELVEWFNQVDATYRADLRDLNELNFARFDAKLEQRMAESDAKWDRRLAQLDAKWEGRLAQLDSKWGGRITQIDAKWENRIAQVDAKVEQRFAQCDAKLEQRLAEQRAELIRWMFLFWVGTVVPLGGLMVALSR